MLAASEKRRVLAAIAVFAIIFANATRARAHVGSPDVFLEGAAGPYHLFVTVRVPQVIPGVAEIDIRANSDDVREIRTTVTTLTGAGSKYAPVPDIATRSAQDPRFFTSSLWLMDFGSLQVRLMVNGSRGKAEMAVPVASFAQRTFTMPRWLGAILLLFVLVLAAGMVSIVGAAARESTLDPGLSPAPENRRRGVKAMTVAAAVAVAIFYFAFAWWGADARTYQDIVQQFKPPKVDATLKDGNRLHLKAAGGQWLDDARMQEMVPDHGHLMHLFLIRTPGLDQIWHLHPEKMAHGEYVEVLPPIRSGHYQIFADLVHQSGFPITMVGSIDLPDVPGKPLSGDDSGGSIAPIGESSAASFALPDGDRVTWERGSKPIRAGEPLFLRFVVRDHSGRPADHLQPYMGMAAHAEIVRDDLSVFAHIHPTGSVPMASLMLASSGASDSAPMAAMAGMAMPDEKLPPDFSLPYGFPRPGAYRIFIQFKQHGVIETAVFDTRVQ